jgi:hypothetical protein
VGVEVSPGLEEERRQRHQLALYEAVILLLMAEIHVKEGRHSEAILCLDLTLGILQGNRVFPMKNVENSCLTMLGQCYSVRGDYKRALDHMEQVIRNFDVEEPA